jgi:hypothetical protein
MLSTNNLFFFIVHAQLRLQRLAAALHYTSSTSLSTTDVAVVGGIAGGMAAHITAMATTSSGRPLISS